MPFLRKKFTSARPAYRRRAAPIRRRKMMGVRKHTQPIHYFKRNTYTINYVTSNSGVDTFKNVAFALADLPNYTEFTNLYDQYQIQSIKYTILPRFNSVSISDGVPETWTIVDKDGTIPTSLSGFLQYQNLRIKRGASTHIRVFKPTPLVNVYNGLTAGYSSPSKSIWIDTANATVPHWGLGIATPVSGTSDPAWDVRVEYRLAFKGVK